MKRLSHDLGNNNVGTAECGAEPTRNGVSRVDRKEPIHRFEQASLWWNGGMVKVWR